MPRPPRLHIPGGFYHVILRGNHRENIFFCYDDRDRFADLVARAVERFQMRVHAYCWMTNHVHLLIQVSDAPLGNAMMCIASPYARKMQRNRSTTGHFFERRYRAILIDAERYLLELVRYIHLNPVRAGIVKDPAEYSWSSHRAYLGETAVPWLTTDFSLRFFAPEVFAARQAYHRFVVEGIGVEPDERLFRGSPQDIRILGDDRFAERLAPAFEGVCCRNLDELIKEIALEHGVTEEQLGSPSRCRRLTRVRALIASQAIEQRCATLSELSRRFHRTVSALSQSVEYYRRTTDTGITNTFTT